MYEVTKETLAKAYKPMDIVSTKNGDVGIIQEVSVNECQPSFDSQISYAIEWLVGDEHKHAWFYHDELKLHGNILIKIAEMVCHPIGGSKYSVQKLFNAMNR